MESQLWIRITILEELIMTGGAAIPTFRLPTSAGLSAERNARVLFSFPLSASLLPLSLTFSFSLSLSLSLSLSFSLAFSLRAGFRRGEREARLGEGEDLRGCFLTGLLLPPPWLPLPGMRFRGM